MGVENGVRAGPPPAGGDGPLRWLQLQDDLLRGLAHALGNRVGTVAGVADLLGVSAAPSPRMIAALRAEADRLEGVLRLLRALPGGRGGAAPEPVLVAEALAEAEALAAHHPAWGEGVAVERALAAGVVHAPPGALPRALCLLLVAAVEPGGAAAAGAVLVAATPAADGGGTIVTVRGGGAEGAPESAGPALGAPDLAALAWLLGGVPGGTVEGIPGGAALRFPG